MSAFIKAVEVVKGGYLSVAPTDRNFNSLLLDAHLVTAEDKYVRDSIGAGFFNTLKDRRTANTINYNSALGPVQIAFPNDPELEELFLTGKLFELISFAVIHESLPFAHFKITSSGVQVNRSDFSDKGSGNDMRFISDRINKRLTFLQSEVTNFLCENRADYEPYGFLSSKFCEGCNKKDTTQPASFPFWY